MITQPRMTSWVFRRVGQGLFGVLTVWCLTNVACPGTSRRPGLDEGSAASTPPPALHQAAGAQPGRPPTPASAGYDVTPRPLDLIEPGTVVGTEAPQGWTHLIIKSQPRVGAGDVNQIAQGTARLAALLYTAILANVEAATAGGPVRHRLKTVAVGMGTRVGDQDMILSPERQRALGADLGFLERAVLSRAHEKLRDVQVVARSDTLTLIDAPNWLQRDGKHVSVILRYAVLVDPDTGKLDTLLWVIDRDEQGGYRGAAGPMEWLPPNKQEDCVLHVDAKEFSLGVPSERAFALNRIPQGRKQVALPDSLKVLAGRMRLSQDMAAQLEQGLREVLKQAAK